MKSLNNQKGFSLIEGVVAMAVLSLGIVAAFTIFNAVILVQQASTEAVRQSMEVNSISEELRISIPSGLSETAIQAQASSLVSKYSNWQAEAKAAPNLPGLYEFKLSGQTKSGKQNVFYAKIFYP